MEAAPRKPGRSMRNTYLVCYDIADDKRLRKVFKTMRDFGDHLQYSIFECQFTAIDLARCRHVLGELIKHNEDQVLFVDLGPTEGRGERVITALGLPYTSMDAPALWCESMLSELPRRMNCPTICRHGCSTNSSIARGCSITNGSRASLPITARRSKGRCGTRSSTLARMTRCPRRRNWRPTGQTIHSRSVTLSSDTYGLIAKLDLIEGEGGVVTPVDYKRGSPREDPTPASWWPGIRTACRLAVQALVLRDNGYRCDEGVIYYVATKQRVRVPIDDALVAQTLEALRQARELAAVGPIPPPLVDSPKCPRCSLVGICLPDETMALPGITGGEPGQQRRCSISALPPQASTIDRHRRWTRSPPAGACPRRSAAAVSEHARPARGQIGAVLKVQEKDKVVQEVRVGEICQLNLFGNIQLSTQAVQALCEQEVPIAYFSQGGWFYGVTQGLGVQEHLFASRAVSTGRRAGFCLRLARALVAGKIRNQRTMLQRNHVEPPAAALNMLKNMQDDAERAESLDEPAGNRRQRGARLFPAFRRHDQERRAVCRRSNTERMTGFRSTLQNATGARRVIRSTLCFRWPTVCWPRT